MKSKYAHVAVASALFAFDKPYSYMIPPSLDAGVCAGMRVLVPFGTGNRVVEGVVLDIYEGEDRPTKAIKSPLDEESFLDGDMLKLALWLRNRCFCTLYDVIRAVLPPGIGAGSGGEAKNEKTERCYGLALPYEEALASLSKRTGEKQRAVLERLAGGDSLTRAELEYAVGASPGLLRSMVKKGLLQCGEETVSRSPIRALLQREPEGGDVRLSEEQQAAYDSLREKYAAREPSCALLFGVTGSGKTLIYIKLISDALADGKGAIMLVPEISLTYQLVKRFYDAFGRRIAVLHSGLSEGERCDEWRRIRKGEADVVIGTRSAVFAPVARGKLGLIILDEEQEYSYKSESAPRYHAREVAKYRSAKSGALLVLGSATPSVESAYAAQAKVYHSVSVKERFGGAALADAEIIDVRGELASGREGAISARLMREIGETAARGEQSILFLNRRGRNRRLVCTACGYVTVCVNCSSAMTYHAANHRMMCHICGYSTQPPMQCPSCGSRHILFEKPGTQKLEEELEAALPGVTYLRMDADTTSARSAHDRLLERFEKGGVDVLIGTQMVTKGLDFENVTLAGVLDADMTLFVNDFRSAERTFSLLTQVVGRSGRGERRGKALIQTMSPQNPVILAAAKQDYHEFYKSEIALRRALFLPPFCSIVVVTLSGLGEPKVLAGANYFRSLLGEGEYQVFGPAPAFILRANKRYRYKITVKITDINHIRPVLYRAAEQFEQNRQFHDVMFSIDVNPYEN